MADTFAVGSLFKKINSDQFEFSVDVYLDEAKRENFTPTGDYKHLIEGFITHTQFDLASWGKTVQK